MKGQVPGGHEEDQLPLKDNESTEFYSILYSTVENVPAEFKSDIWVFCAFINLLTKLQGCNLVINPALIFVTDSLKENGIAFLRSCESCVINIYQASLSANSLFTGIFSFASFLYTDSILEKAAICHKLLTVRI